MIIVLISANFFHERSLTCLLESDRKGELQHPVDSVCTSYLKNKFLILDDLTEPDRPAEKLKNPGSKSSWYLYVLFFFMLGLAVGSSAALGRRVAFCGPKKRFCGNYYIRFVQEEDAISISERIGARKGSGESTQVESAEEPTVSAARSPIQQSEQPAESESNASSSKTDDRHQAADNEFGC